jgi:serine phosphatase RsbU (regulator of sigma subunit)
MYTDGLSEARDESGEFLPLLSVAPLLREGSGDEALDRLLDAVRAHIPRGQLNDDLAVLLIEHLSDQVEPASWPAVRTLGLQLADR